MNYLAHAALAQDTLPSLVGNLLGDFCKGVQLAALEPAVLAGLHNHRAVDRFTDQHPLLLTEKKCFSPQRRRFAGVALDVLFDHYLIKYWQRFYEPSFEQAKAQLYQRLANAEPLMPEMMRFTMQKVRQQDWFASYQEPVKVGFALDRIAQRIRFPNQFTGVIDEIMPRYQQLEQVFLEFYPQLQNHIKQQALE